MKSKWIFVPLAALLTGAAPSCSGESAGSSPVSNGASSTGGAGTDAGGAPTAYPDGCDPIIPEGAIKCWSDACKDQRCGADDSVYDADGCFKVCQTNADCEATETCREVEYSRVTCDGEDPCNCGTDLAIHTRLLCSPGAANGGGSWGSASTGGTDAGGAPTAYPEGCQPIIPEAALRCWSDACKDQRCGSDDSVYDGAGCFKVCQTDADCKATETCREVEYSGVTCDGDDPCNCGTDLAIHTRLLCAPRVD